MKRRTFIDYLQDLFTDIADAVAEPVVLVLEFLEALPGFRLVKEFEILPEGTLLRGFVADQTKSFSFEFHESFGKNEVDVILNNEFIYSGSWAEATSALMDTVSPGDRMMTIGSHRSKGEVNLFSYEKPKQTVV